MHPDTLAALQRLTEALIAHPDDAATLRCYGHLPAHLADAIEDHEPELAKPLAKPTDARNST